MTTDGSMLDSHTTMNLQAIEVAALRTDTGSGSVENDIVLSVQSMGTITGPYGTADNTYATADQNPELPGFTDEITPQMDFRADCDPRFQFIARSSPRSFGYSYGYMTGTAEAPNGYPVGSGITFPNSPQVGDYFLRIDYLPNILFRWDGQLWVRIDTNVRTGLGMTEEDNSQQSTFINNNNVTVLTDGGTMPQKQALSSILTIAPDTIPPII
jgi:hypothetical protein